jgi:hypothetical protein
MRALVFALLVGASIGGCSGSQPTDDAGSGADLSSPGDGGGSTDMALLPLGAMGCMTNADCQSMVCAPYMMGVVKRCTLACTVGQPAPQCVAPSNGTCNGMGYCKFN